MAAHRLVREQIVPCALEEVFDFFSKAENLQELTPPWVHFRILTPLPIQMREGALIDYRITVRGLPMKWRTRIDVWEPGVRFVDRQLSGPYRQWIHLHEFEAVEGGTLIRDTVDFVVPGGPFAALVARIVVPDVERLFDYRRKAIDERFCANPAPPLAVLTA
jgi:ligand-binding SRPBCC domain-containing protein